MKLIETTIKLVVGNGVFVLAMATYNSVSNENNFDVWVGILAALFLQGVLFMTGVILGWFQLFLNKLIADTKETEHDNQAALEEQAKEEAFQEVPNVTNINFDIGQPIGLFKDEKIFNFIHVTFENGVTVLYEYNTVIANFKADDTHLYVGNLEPGSILLQPGIVYTPAK